MQAPTRLPKSLFWLPILRKSFTGKAKLLGHLGPNLSLGMFMFAHFNSSPMSWSNQNNPSRDPVKLRRGECWIPGTNSFPRTQHIAVSRPQPMAVPCQYYFCLKSVLKKKSATCILRLDRLGLGTFEGQSERNHVLPSSTRDGPAKKSWTFLEFCRGDVQKNHSVQLVQLQPIPAATFLVVVAAPCLGANAAIPEQSPSPAMKNLDKPSQAWTGILPSGNSLLLKMAVEFVD